MRYESQIKIFFVETPKIPKNIEKTKKTKISDIWDADMVPKSLFVCFLEWGEVRFIPTIEIPNGLVGNEMDTKCHIRTLGVFTFAKKKLNAHSALF